MRCPVNHISIVQTVHTARNGKKYYAIDFGYGKWGYRNQPVYSADDGVVIYNRKQKTGGYTIMIKHDSGYCTVYGHLKKDSQKVLEGYRVKKGQQIACMGNSGIVTGYHLHFEIYKGTGIYTGHDRSIDALSHINMYDDQEVVAHNKKPRHTLHVTARDGLNIRAGIGTRHKIVGVLPYNAEVENYGVKNGWLCVDNLRGYYVSAKWAK